jgi:nucleoside-diphosphate-sugar epimerase
VASRFADDETIHAGEPSPGSSAYGATKLFGERIGKAFAQTHGISTVALRLGYCRPGANEPTPASAAWEDTCWISNADVCRGLDYAMRAEIRGFVVVNLTSANAGSRWSLVEARELLGYEAADGYTPPSRGRAPVVRVKRRRIFARLRAALGDAR